MAGTRRQLSWRPTLANVCMALLGVPVAWAFNAAVNHSGPAGILVLAVIVLSIIVVFLRQLAPAQDKIFYAFSMFSFTSVVDILIPLEMDGWVEGFMDVYMVHGEPYLFSAWGALSAYWDGSFNLICYIYMAFCVSNRKSYRNIAIFYASNILNSMIVLLVGAFLSGTGLHWCTLLNIPYVLVPAYVLWTWLESPHHSKTQLTGSCALRNVSVVLLFLGVVFNVFRGIASFGSRVEWMAQYRQWVEPLMNQKIPAPFAPVQHIVGLFYFAPAFFVLAVAIIKNPNRLWIKDLAVATAGAALQAEVCLMGMEWHPLTQEIHRLPADAGAVARFLHISAHLATLLAPAVCVFALFFPTSAIGPVVSSAFSIASKAISSKARLVVTANTHKPRNRRHRKAHS